MSTCRHPIVAASCLLALAACGRDARQASPPGDVQHPDPRSAVASQPADYWNSATVYFLLTDRFANGNPENDTALGRAQDGAVLRSYMGGDLAGLRNKIEEGWFDALGVDAIWFTPFQEQIHGDVDEGTGKTYAFHGYWPRDWTAVEPALGTVDDLRAVVEAAHARGMRVVMDAIINHTGPVTPLDPQWPDSWVRTGPKCGFDTYATTVTCALVENLPDIRTESDEGVELPDFLLARWEAEGRLEQELAELDAFFERTGYPRAPRFYLIKWLTDWVRELGFDGYRVDTARNFDEDAALELKAEADLAFADWKAANPDRVLDDLPFYMFGEVYGWNAAGGRAFDFGDRQVDYFDYGYDGLINFGLKVPDLSTRDAFTLYGDLLNGGALEGVSILSYLSSHDDSSPWDARRSDPYGAAIRLLLAPGGAQVYYGDELARPLIVPGATTDANLRSFMRWDDVERVPAVAALLDHWRKLGRFRQDHPAVGAGEHVEHQATPYVFSRVLDLDDGVDRVLVGIDMPRGPKVVPVFGVFPEGAELVDAYSGQTATVSDGEVTLSGDFDIVLLEERVAAEGAIGS